VYITDLTANPNDDPSVLVALEEHPVLNVYIHGDELKFTASDPHVVRQQYVGHDCRLKRQVLGMICACIHSALYSFNTES
jgi:hypothetical protein